MLQCRITQDIKIVEGLSTGARSESGFSHYGNSTTGRFPRHGSYRESHGMAAGSVGIEGISLNHRKSQALLGDGVGPEHLTEEQRTAMDHTAFTVVQQRIRLMEVPVGTEHFTRNFL